MYFYRICEIIFLVGGPLKSNGVLENSLRNGWNFCMNPDNWLLHFHRILCYKTTQKWFGGSRNFNMFTWHIFGDRFSINPQFCDIFFYDRLQNVNFFTLVFWGRRVISYLYYSFKIFIRFPLAKRTRIIHRNRLLLTKFAVKNERKVQHSCRLMHR